MRDLHCLLGLVICSPWALGPQALEPQSPWATKPLSHRPLSHRPSSHRPLSHKALEPKAFEPQALEPQAFDPQSPWAIGPWATGLWATAFEPQSPWATKPLSHRPLSNCGLVHSWGCQNGFSTQNKDFNGRHRNQVDTAHISHYSYHWQWCTFFKLVYFLIWRTRHFLANMTYFVQA